MLELNDFRLGRFSVGQFATWVMVAMIASGILSCTHADAGKPVSASAVRSYLQEHVGWGPATDKAMRYSFTQVSLGDASSQQVFVYISGPESCGSGGCTALLLEPQGTSFRVIDRFTLARLPIRILPSKTNGWHDLSMPVAGGGIIPGYFAILKFDGHNYPSNPSMAPKLPENLTGTGVEVPLSEHGNLVY